MKQGKLSFSKILGVAALLQCSVLFAADNADDYDFTTVVAAPENAEVLNVKSVFNATADLVFFSSKNEDHAFGGFYKLDADARLWSEFKLPITLDYSDTDNHGIVDATDGPHKNTLVLSYKTDDKGTTQYLSNTGNGALWHSLKINVLESFTNIAKTNVYGLEYFVVYGRDHQSSLVSPDGNSWVHRLLPTTCFDNKKCTFTNRHFASVDNGYILLQSNVTDASNDSNSELDTESVLENKLLFTPDFTNWYYVDIPFTSDEVHAVFKSHLSGLLASVTNKKDGSHKLWFTKDYKNWSAYDLPVNTKVLVAQTGYQDYITLSLSDGKKSDLIILDPETQTQNVFATFEGDVTDMTWHRESLNLSGNFVNFKDESKALLVNVTKKVSDDNSSQEDTEEHSEQALIDTNYLRPFK